MQEYSLPEKEQQPVQVEAPVEKEAEETPAEVTSEAVVEEKTEENPAADESTPVSEESGEATEPEVGEAEEAAEEQPEIKVWFLYDPTTAVEDLIPLGFWRQKTESTNEDVLIAPFGL